MKSEIVAYQQAYHKSIAAQHKLEELRCASVPYLNTRMETAWNEDGKATNWYNLCTKDKTILRKFKDFQAQVTIVSSLCQKAAMARRKMVEAIEQLTEGESI